MKIKLISYGHKFYEQENIAPPYHDFLFSLRDLINPFWVPELKEMNGTDAKIVEFFQKDPRTNERLEMITKVISEFVEDFLNNEHRKEGDTLVFAFKCTGGKHRSVYFTETIFKAVKDSYGQKIEVELDHIDLPRYLSAV